MTPAASRWTARGLLMAAAVVAGACSRSGRPLVSKVRAVDASGPVWSLPKECQSCLLTECEPLDSGSAPYGACAKDPICFEAFASFAACFGRKPLKDCAADVALIHDIPIRKAVRKRNRGTPIRKDAAVRPNRFLGDLLRQAGVGGKVFRHKAKPTGVDRSDTSATKSSIDTEMATNQRPGYVVDLVQLQKMMALSEHRREGLVPRPVEPSGLAARILGDAWDPLGPFPSAIPFTDLDWGPSNGVDGHSQRTAPGG